MHPPPPRRCQSRLHRRAGANERKTEVFNRANRIIAVACNRNRNWNRRCCAGRAASIEHHLFSLKFAVNSACGSQVPTSSVYHHLYVCSPLSSVRCRAAAADTGNVPRWPRTVDLSGAASSPLGVLRISPSFVAPAGNPST